MSEFSRYWDAESSAVMPPRPRVPAEPASPAAPPPTVPYAAAPAIPLLGPIGPAPAPRRKFTARRLVSNTLIFLIGVGGGVVAFAWVQTKLDSTSVPRELRAYVAGGGVTYAPAGQGYSVRLPFAPVRRDGPSRVHRSVVSGPSFEIVVRETDLPSATALKSGLAGAVYDPAYSGTTELVNVHAVSFATMPAYAFDAGLSSGVPVRNRMFAAGNRLFLISVQSESAEAVFGALSASFQLRN